MQYFIFIGALFTACSPNDKNDDSGTDQFSDDSGLFDTAEPSDSADTGETEDSGETDTAEPEDTGEDDTGVDDPFEPIELWPLSDFDFTVPGEYDLQGRTYINDHTPDFGPIYVGDYTNGEPVTIKNGRILFMEEGQPTDEGDGIFSMPYDFDSGEGTIQIQLWDPSSDQFPRMAQFPPPPHPDLRVSWTATNSWWDLNVPSDAVEDHLLHDQNNHFSGFVLTLTENADIQTALRDALDQVIAQEATISTREEAAVGAGIQLLVYPNAIHTTTIATYDDGGGTGDITIGFSEPRPFNTTYLRFSIFGRKTWLVGNDNVYTLDVPNNKILYKPASGQALQLFHTPQAIHGSAGLRLYALTPLHLEDLSIVGTLNPTGWMVQRSSTQEPIPKNTVQNSEFLLGAHGIAPGATDVDNSVFNGQKGYGMALFNSGHDTVVKNSRFVGMEQKTALSAIGQGGPNMKHVEITGNYFSIPWSNHGQAISMYDGRWTNANIHHNIFHNCQRPLSMQNLPMVLRFDLENVSGSVTHEDEVTVDGVLTGEVITLYSSNNELLIHYSFADVAQWEALPDSGVTVTGPGFSATTTSKEFSGAVSSDTLSGFRFENNLVYYDTEQLPPGGGQLGISYNASGNLFDYLNGNGDSIIVRGNTILVDEALAAADPDHWRSVGVDLNNANDLSVAFSGNIATYYGAPEQRAGGSGFSLAQGDNVFLKLSSAYSSQDTFLTLDGITEKEWLSAQADIIDPLGFGINPALSVGDQAYYANSGIQWSSIPSRSELANLPLDWAQTYTELPLPAYEEDLTSSGEDNRPYVAETILSGGGTPLVGSTVMAENSVYTDVDTLSTGAWDWLNADTANGWDDGIDGYFYLIHLNADWRDDVFSGYSTSNAQLTAINEWLTNREFNFYVDGLLDSRKPIGVSPTNVFETYWRFRSGLNPAAELGGFPYDGSEVGYEILELTPYRWE